jgi:hypothetical protein
MSSFKEAFLIQVILKIVSHSETTGDVIIKKIPNP